MHIKESEIFRDMENKGYPIVALCYDFDKTLSPKDMQEYGFIKRLGMSAEEFWEKSNSLAVNDNMDTILAYMFTMTQEARKRNINVTECDLKNLGKDIKLFDGVQTWFERINNIGIKNGVIIEHYIISSGIREIIEGNAIAKHFKRIYASSFYYDENKKAIWPKQAVNFTTKTQYLFRINKSCELEDVNMYMPDEERRIPFSHFIYIGDSETDIPCMRLVKNAGGSSIGVYNPEDKSARKTVLRLINEKRINYFAPSVYTEESEIEEIVTRILQQIKAKHSLLQLTKLQTEQARD